LVLDQRSLSLRDGVRAVAPVVVVDVAAAVGVVAVVVEEEEEEAVAAAALEAEKVPMVQPDAIT
jgi:hypothetical protein